MSHVQPGNPSNYSELRRLALYIVAVLVGGAVFSVPLFLGTQAALQALHITAENARTWPMTEVVKADFERFFNRAVLLCALLGLPLMIRAARGGGAPLLPPLKPDAPALRQALTGFILAAGLLLALGWAYCRTGIYEVNPKAFWIALGQPVTAALGAGIVEELLFRGFILGLMLRSLSVPAAMFWTTFIFAIVHFLKPPEAFHLPPGQVNWHSGWNVIAAIFGHFANLDFLLAEFFTLFAVGWVVAQARVTTGSLWPGIGLHAGWVFGLKYFSGLTLGSKALRHGDYLPWVGDNLKIGLVPLVIVLATGWLASFSWRKHS
ncbi:MAG: hypothetical protein JWO94_1140, partial [Verrucomicrobiaceae bacterium]|nr:hypothetical protein [Verrucomicrobiaceae bacterium]